MPTTQNEDVIVEHNGEYYNVGKFSHFHPGGKATIEALKGKDITKKFTEYEHSPSACYLMKEYKIGNDFRGNDDLENLVDWNKPMLKQVGQLGFRYSEWIQSPVDRKLRLFESDFLEKLTVTPWYMIPIIWIPFDIYLLYIGISYNKLYFQDSYVPAWVLLPFISGIVLWTLLEYLIHRWVFHREPPTTSPKLITAHFLMHGLHHKVPFDESRLLIPPVPAAIVITFFFWFFYFTLPFWMVHILSAGALAGYITYDLTHFYLHYGSPRPNSYMYHMKRYHNHHHFTQHQSGFGISSDFWDQIFGTRIILKKLKLTLKW